MRRKIICVAKVIDLGETSQLGTVIKPLPRPGPLGSAEFRLTFPGADSEIDPGDLRISVLYGHRLLLMVASVLADQVENIPLDGVLQARPDLDKVGQVWVVLHDLRQAGRQDRLLRLSNRSVGKRL